ncbi:GGDEF domain-containing protein [Alteromonas facilis]|uniref:GGDEF domain-containing protein n=1 Tax=Alteromonas facilis TaxID=2048004 RepID=UPI0013DAE634|nr:GGDEF domain-containing protein [Alteromonas facilis]
MNEPQSSINSAFNTSVHASKYIRRYSLFIGLCITLIGFTGYMTEQSILYRYYHQWPASNPHTLILSVLLLVSVFNFDSTRLPKLSAAILVPASLLILFLGVEQLFSLEIAEHFSPFSKTVSTENLQGLGNVTGINTLCMFFAYCMSLLFYLCKKPVIAQGTASIGVLFPMVSLTGYLLNIAPLHGDMALSTTFIGLCLGLSLMMLTPDVGLMKAMFHDSYSGKITRRLATVALTFPVIMFFTLFIFAPQHIELDIFRWFFVSACWFSILLVLVGGLLFADKEADSLSQIKTLSFAATHDELTGLHNRRYFNEVIKIAIARASREKSTLWLVMIDLDHFKLINDRYGHDTGDLLLAEASRKMLQTVRETDVLCRWGGEEFMLLVEGESEGDIIKLSQRLSDCFHTICTKDEFITLSASIGITQYMPKENAHQFLWRADKAMYKAKEKRDCIALATPRKDSPSMRFNIVETSIDTPFSDHK